MTSPNADGIYLLIFQAWDGSTVSTFYVATHDYTTEPGDDIPNQTFEGRLVNAGELKRSMFENGGTVGKPGRTQGYFELSNADGALDAWLDYGPGGWDFWLYYLASRDADYSTKTLAYKGTMRGFSSDDLRTTIKIRIRDKLESLDRPLLTETYAGTTNSTGATAEGDSEMRGQLKPYSIGRLYQEKAAPANSFDLIYQGSITAQAILRPSDGGATLTPAGPADYATLAALQAATTGIFGSGANIEAGEYATCLALGLCRLAALPAKAISLEMFSATAQVDRSAGAVAEQILLDGGVSSLDIDSASFTALTTSSGAWEVGVYVDSDVSILDVVCSVLNSISATLVATRDGTIKAVSLGAVPGSLSFNPIFEDEAVVDTFTNDDLSADSQFILRSSPQAEGDAVPAYGVNIKWRPRGFVLSAGDLLPSTSPANVNSYGKKYIELSQGNSDILAHNPLAQLLQFETCLMNGTGAIIQGLRRLDFYSKRRDYITFTVSMDRAGDVELGDIIVIQPTNAAGSPRYGYGVNGKRGCVIGRWDRFSNRTVVFTVFVAVG
jgi:hypothetical protein